MTQGDSQLPPKTTVEASAARGLRTHRCQMRVPFREIPCLKHLPTTIDIKFPMGPETKLEALTLGPRKYSNERLCLETSSPHPDPQSYEDQASTGKIGLSSRYRSLKTSHSCYRTHSVIKQSRVFGLREWDVALQSPEL